MNDFLYPDESYAIRCAAFEVYKDKGCGFLEPVYQECFEIELSLRHIPFIAQDQLKLTYKGQELKHRYIPDVSCYGKIIIELKAVKEITDEHRAQPFKYLKATGYELGFLINFGHHTKVQIERIARSSPPPL
jgi:GxxExxY protein